MCLLVLAHVDGDEVLLAAVQGLGQRDRGFGLADARGASEHEDTNRFARVVEAGARGLDALGDHLHRMVLADHALAERGRQVQDVADLVGRHAADGDAGPVGHHRGHGLVVHRRQDQRRLALQLLQLRLQIFE